MSVSQSMHPLGYGDTDQIDPAVAAALTTSQVEWLFRQCQELSLKKTPDTPPGSFEWVDEHPDYRFSVSTFGSAMRVALENYMNRHQAEFMSAKACATLLVGLAGLSFR
jgi:hypothetical protein